ncbi:MAG: hypothetical protein IKZ27_01020 [Kiritimatiellae bacterium]|nr:hypothetical protein [Kiritimatiellia bacterium]
MNRKSVASEDRDLFVGEIISRAEALAPYGIIQRDDPSRSIRDRYLLTIKPEMARALFRFVKSAYAQDLFARLEALGINPTPERKDAVGSALTGLSFVITGTLSKPREYFEEQIRNQGGTVQSSVSKKTSFLLIGENPGGSKYNKAQALQIPMMPEATFWERLSGSGDTTPPPPPQPAPKAPAKRKKTTATAPTYIQEDLFGAF